MKLTSKEVQAIEQLRRLGDGAFTVVRQGGDIRQVAKQKPKKDIDASGGGALSSHTSDGDAVTPTLLTNSFPTIK